MAVAWQDIADDREKYAAYLCSREWAEKREAVRARSRGTCERCKRNPMDACHHLTYARKYDEQLDDLQAICNPCHEFTHGKRDVDPVGLDDKVEAQRDMFALMMWRPDAAHYCPMPAAVFKNYGKTDAGEMLYLAVATSQWKSSEDFAGLWVKEHLADANCPQGEIDAMTSWIDSEVQERIWCRMWNGACGSDANVAVTIVIQFLKAFGLLK